MSLQQSVTEWERILSQSAVTPRHHGQKASVYPYTVEVRWNSAVEEQVLHEDITSLSLETQRLQSQISMLENHVASLPNSDVNAPESALSMVRGIDTHLQHMLANSREVFISMFQDAAALEAMGTYVAPNCLPMYPKDRQCAIEALRNIANLGTVLERINSLLEVYLNAHSSGTQFHAVDDVLNEATLSAMVLEEVNKYSLTLRAFHGLVHRLGTSV
eukprot:PhF_6_TR11395/c0_g1_i1/m.18350